MKKSQEKTKTGAIIIEGHVQGLSNTRSLGEAGIPVYVIDKTNCVARYSRYCKKFFYCPDYISEEFPDFLIKLAEKESIKGWILIPSNDHAVYSISRNRERLGEYYKIITPGISIIENIYDKSRLLALAEKIKVPYPATHYFKTERDPLPDSLRFPLITKGRNGLTFYRAMGRKALLAGSETELREQLKKISEKYSVEETFTQELIPDVKTNKTISFTAFCDKGDIKAHWIGEKIREHPVRFGTATFACSVECKEVLESSALLLMELKYTGVCEVEYLYDPRDKKYKLIEINARTWLWIGLARDCGVDYAKMIYGFVNELPMDYPSGYKTGIKWINYLTDTPFAILAIFHGILSVKEYFSSLRGRKTNALFSWNDLKPAIMFFILSIYIAFKRR